MGRLVRPAQRQVTVGAATANQVTALSRAGQSAAPTQGDIATIGKVVRIPGARPVTRLEAGVEPRAAAPHRHGHLVIQS